MFDSDDNNPNNIHGEVDADADWGTDDDSDPIIEKVVRLSKGGVWHGVNETATYCHRKIAERDLIKSRDASDELCRACVTLFEIGSGRTFLEDALALNELQSLDDLRCDLMDSFDKGYIRKLVRQFVGNGQAHICARESRTNTNLYRRGTKADCPDPKYHG
jgi:uncharacterized protein YerC